MSKFVFFAALLVCATTANAECHFKSSNSIMCLRPADALQAYRLYGADNPKAKEPYFKQYLQNYGCQTADAVLPEMNRSNANPENRKIFERGVLKYPTPDGYELIGSYNLGRYGPTYFASTKEISGTCSR